MERADHDELLDAIALDDSFELVRVLADSESGRTELVRRSGGAAPLVRKRIPLALANESAWQALRGVGHPRLPHVRELYRLPDAFVAVYDFVPGRTLKELVDERGWIAAPDAAAWLLQVCDAVGACHAAGVVHRDLTPGNVVVASDGAHVVDLGIARRMSAGSARDTTTLGTYGFAAPEQFGFAPTDARSDVYSLGRLLGYLLTGVTPDQAGFERALADEALVDVSLRAIVERACAFEPSERYQGAGELAAALEAVLPALGASVSPEQPRPQARPRACAAPLPGGSARQGAQAPAGQAPRAQAAAGERARDHALALALIWLACAIVVVMFWGAGAQFLAQGLSVQNVACALIGLAFGATAVAVGRELTRALLRRGRYAAASAGLGAALRRCVALVGVGVALAALCALVFIALGGGSPSTPSSQEQPAAQAQTPASSPVTLDATAPQAQRSATSQGSAAQLSATQQGAGQAGAATARYDVSVDGAELTSDFSGNPAVVVTFSFTNRSDAATSLISAVIPEVYQDGVQCQMAMAQTDGNALSRVKPGSTVSASLAYSVKDGSDITVEVREAFDTSGELLAQATLPLG